MTTVSIDSAFFLPFYYAIGTIKDIAYGLFLFKLKKNGFTY